MSATRLRIFVSSVQKELAEERRAAKAFIDNDPLLRRFPLPEEAPPPEVLTHLHLLVEGQPTPATTGSVRRCFWPGTSRSSEPAP